MKLQIFFIFISRLGEDEPILTNILSGGLKPPTSWVWKNQSLGNWHAKFVWKSPYLEGSWPLQNHHLGKPVKIYIATQNDAIFERRSDTFRIIYTLGPQNPMEKRRFTIPKYGRNNPNKNHEGNLASHEFTFWGSPRYISVRYIYHMKSP